MSSLTVIVTQSHLGVGGLSGLVGTLAKPDGVHLFFLHRGVGLVGDDFSFLPEGRRVYCAFDHARFAGPPSTIQAGGLVVLGQLLRESDGVMSFPHGLKGTTKRLAVCLDRSAELATEGLRLAVGLRGCNQEVALFAASPRSWLTLNDLGGLQVEAGDYVDAWKVLGGTSVDQPLKEPDPYHGGAVLRL